MAQISDKEIVDLLRTDPEAGFRLMVRGYRERLYWHVRKMVVVHDDADDVLQNIFIKAWRGLDSFREDSKLFTWLYRIAINESLTFLAEKRKKNIFTANDIEDDLFGYMASDSFFDGDAAELKLQKAILLLPEKQRLVFNMRYYDNIKYEEMSDVLQTSVGALNASYHHAAAKIEKYLLEED
jgi:RNA polymerase sigma-70 factor, ECF subfamily